jgi:exopolysaccharide production protein ExoQ
MEIIERMDRPNFYCLVNTWMLCAILLVFASVYGFSFERGTLNSFLGAETYGMAAGLTASDSQASIIVKAQSFVVYALCLAFICRSGRPILNRLQQHALILCVLAWAVLSAIWSTNPSTSAINAIRMMLNLALVFCLFERYSANELQKLLMLVGSVAAAGSLIMVFVFPQYGLQSRGLYALGAWEGIFGQKNICGLEMLALLLPAFFVKMKHRYGNFLRVGYIATVLLIIAMTRSAGAWIITSLCLAFIVLLKVTERMRRKDAALVAFGVAVVVAAIGITAIANFNTLMYALGKDPTMTGRTMIWSVLERSIAKRPVLGYGYDAFWDGPHGESGNVAIQLNVAGYASAESGVLELWLELGVIGVLIYGVIYARAVSDAFRCLSREATPAVLWYTSILFFVLVSNIEGGLLLTPSNLTCILPFIAFVGLRREAERIHLERLA